MWSTVPLLTEQIDGKKTWQGLLNDNHTYFICYGFYNIISFDLFLQHDMMR